MLTRRRRLVRPSFTIWIPRPRLLVPRLALVVPTVGQLAQAGDYQAAWNTNNLKLHLYSNNYTPVAGSLLANFTEATFSGYAAQTITAWQSPITVSGRAQLTASALYTFTKSTGAVGNNIYGYYVTDSTGTTLKWAERDAAAPIDMNTAGKKYTILPTYTVKSEF